VPRYTVRDFLNSILLESLHPELQAIAAASHTPAAKQTMLAKKIRELSARGESTGIEGNMPKGTSRAYLKHQAAHPIKVDGQDTSIPTGTKVAIRCTLDKHHDKEYFGGNLGNMQNEAENGDGHANYHYRVLTETRRGEYETNEAGIFPPLIDHDYENHGWSHVGHASNITRGEFPKLTKAEGYPKGITHGEFCETLERFHNRNNGRHWKESDEREAHLDHIEQHPLVQKFIDYHGNYAAPPHDYRQIANLGKWKHPITGEHHIVARDAGFSSNVAEAYMKARLKRLRGR
jgi:hypothetical protein